MRGALNEVVYHLGVLAVLIAFVICSWSGGGRAVKLILCGCTADIVKQLSNLEFRFGFRFVYAGSRYSPGQLPTRHRGKPPEHTRKGRRI